jgi:hypothetical protein
MNELPSHPDTGQEPAGEPDPIGRSNASRAGRVVLVGLVILAAAVMVVLHLTGAVGPGSH